MYEVGDEIYLRDSSDSAPAVAVILEARPEEPEYFVFLAGLRGERPFSETRWMAREELERRACASTLEKEKMGLDFLSVTGNKVDHFVFYALSEMRDLMEEATAIECAAAEGAKTFEEKVRLLDAQVKVRQYRGYDVEQYRKESEITARVS
ncbi:MAG: hypothetical protein JXA90_17265 [Planctomycetes bacterium]|nr:hypothetical protein [Planctomycetota bacterium]